MLIKFRRLKSEIWKNEKGKNYELTTTLQQCIIFKIEVVIIFGLRLTNNKKKINWSYILVQIYEYYSNNAITK